MGATAHLAPDQPGVFERLDVLRGRRERDRERLRKLADRSLPGASSKHPPTSFVAESMKDSVQPRHLSFNHVVEYGGAPRKSQPLG